ncbi:EAL domain-containing protein [Vibrio galatheae]|uniref:EAL domain-containing protein n=1 Tax=Vibrio galatheae TaxID=579748 RepID=UPI000695D441|nr:EAL domain-containing protein [Vibrio galatheae]
MIKLQVSALCFLYVAFFAVVSSYTQRPNRKLYYFICGYSLLVLVLNLISDYSVRFVEPAYLHHFDVLGFNASLIRAEPSPLGYIFHGFTYVYLGWVFYSLFHFLKAKLDSFTIGFGIFALLIVIAGYMGSQIDRGELESVYVVGFVFTAFIIFMSFLLQKDLRAQNRLVVKYQASLEAIAKGVTYESGHHFYQQLVTHLSDIIGAKYCFIGLLSQDKETISTKAVCVNGVVADNFSYSLKDTPCENVMANEICQFPEGVQALFPSDHLLEDMHIQSYIGAPILNDHDTPIGLFVVLDTKPRKTSKQIKHIVEIFSARASAEIQRDIALRKVRSMAYEDYLTRLPNRAQAYEYLQNKIDNPRHAKDTICLYFLDLDHFKTINDALGHDIGDDLLRVIGRKLSEFISPNQFVARVGGDEFLIVSDAYDGQFDKQLLDVFDEPIVMGDHLIDINLSIGVAQVVAESSTVLDMMRFTELALYKAKNSGRNCSVMYKPEMQTAAIEKLNIQSALKKAIGANRLSLYYQPQVTSSQQVYGAEALLRWHDPELGFVSPADFIPLAEETGLIHPIGEWVLDESLRFLASIEHTHRDNIQHLSINISAWQFALPNFAEYILAKIQQWNINPQSIMLELTETAVLRDVEDAKTKLIYLNKNGIKVALDDFGTGYSSLAYLRDLPIDVLKIDKAFIDELQAQTSSPLTDTIISIGQSINVDVIAEGVETEQQAQKLEALGCHIYQGFLFAKPMPEEQLLQWLGSRSNQQLVNSN